MTLDWYFMFLRALIALTAGFMGVNLIVAFAKNHYLHKPKRWLVGWQGLLFFGVGLDAFWRMLTRARFIFSGATQNVTSWQYLVTGSLVAIGATGCLFVWLKWPTSRTTGGHDRRKGDAS